MWQMACSNCSVAHSRFSRGGRFHQHRSATRLLSDMKRRDLIRLEGATLVIPNRIALQAIAA
jgi:hypothetical protein